ncbi:MAG TPA: response regulator [Caulobacterales bacterium]|nr:response regulator [Caulobacterales bacterium]
MQKSASFDASGLTVLVLDRSHQQRLITMEQLRLMGFGAVSGESSTAQTWEALQRDRPEILLLDWLDPQEDALEFVRRIRQAEDSPTPGMAIFMLSVRGSLGEVESARTAGCDGYLRKPISALAIQERLKAVVVKPRQFVRTASYVGPCRRRRDDPDYPGPWRRASDAPANAERIRNAVAALEAAARDQIGSNLAEPAQALVTMAGLTFDAQIGFGARELLRYLDAHEQGLALDEGAVRTHIAALAQLASLPPALSGEREKLAQSLKRMVDKKLRA